MDSYVYAKKRFTTVRDLLEALNNLSYNGRDAAMNVTDAEGNIFNQLEVVENTLSDGSHTYDVRLRVVKPEELFPAETVTRSLHFATRIAVGKHHNHIVNNATFDVHLEKRTIRPGDTLCATRNGWGYISGVLAPTCPGCIAIAQGLAARDAEK